MSAVPDVFPACDHTDGCITCGDVAVAMKVELIDAGRGLALCADEHGERATIEVELVAPVAVGDEILVHAGTALVRL